MKILVINCGSSTVKFKLFRRENSRYPVLAAGQVEKIGSGSGRVQMQWPGGELDMAAAAADHHAALELAEELLLKNQVLGNFSDLDLAVHRVVHGGEKFTRPVRVDEAVLTAIRELVPLAPLHNPYNLEGIISLRRRAPLVPQVAVFDTAFHQRLPAAGYVYALPYEFYRDRRIRRYGFHGISHGYLARTAAACLGRDQDSLRLITLHLGNGASAAAIAGGCSIDTSMGMTPMEGLVMGTRSGDLDPGVMIHLQRHYGLEAADLDDLLNRRSGLQGICGAGDMREVLSLAAGGSERAQLALEIFSRRLKKYIGAYYALLGGLDGLVFSGGIGAYSPAVRKMVCAGLEHLGVRLDEEKNQAASGPLARLDDGGLPVRILAVVTDEELEMARQAWHLVNGESQSPA